MMGNPAWPIDWPFGGAVWKKGRSYEGPGRIVGFAYVDNNALRILVAHKIEGGQGEFVHEYAPDALEPPNPTGTLTRIAEAIEAERAACEKIAREEADNLRETSFPFASSSEKTVGKLAAAMNIAEAIAERKSKPR